MILTQKRWAQSRNTPKKQTKQGLKPMQDAAIKLSDVRDMVRQKHGPSSSDFDLSPDAQARWPSHTKLRSAAVLVPLLRSANGLDVILTKRASHLKHHPGQIAFPGGKTEKSDANAENTAVREAFEEIGLESHNVDVLGILPFHETVTNFRITPVIGHVLNDFVTTAQPGEVAEVFRVPLNFLANTDNYLIQGRMWGGSKRLYYTVPYGPYYIWGATARILRAMAGRLGKS